MPSQEVNVAHKHNKTTTSNHIHSTGSVQVDGTLNVDDKATFTKGLQVTHAVPTPATTVTLSAATHGNRKNIIESVSTTGADSYVLPTAAVVGEWYQFIWGGVAADGDNIIFKASGANGLTFSGGILSTDEDATAATRINMKYPGGDDDKVTITNPTGFDITFVAVTTTKYCVSGWVASTDTHTAFGDI